MNIIVKPYNSQLCYCRPDTTWEKENRDLYIPEDVDKVLWSPVIFAKVNKAGKCVSEKFVARYYDAIGFGALIYCNEDNIAFSSCLDHTSILPTPTQSPEVFENVGNTLTLKIGDKSSVFEVGKEMKNALEEALCKASERISLRIGDMVAVELAPLEVVAERENGATCIRANFCENNLFDLKIIF